jgi:hypothetical protein
VWLILPCVVLCVLCSVSQDERVIKQYHAQLLETRAQLNALLIKTGGKPLAAAGPAAAASADEPQTSAPPVHSGADQSATFHPPFNE